MYQKVVIPGMDLGSRLFNSSCKPYNNLDSRFTMRCPGMTKRGFTLIELLVVVLIIGILAAVALPQYQKAVEKAKASEAIGLFNTLEKAEDLYFLSNGRYTRNLDQLDFQMPEIGHNTGYGQNQWYTKNFSYWVDAEGFGWNAGMFKGKARAKNKKYQLVLELNKGNQKILWCGPYSDENWPARPAENNVPDICKAIAGCADGIIYEQ